MRHHLWSCMIAAILITLGFARVGRSEPFVDVNIGGAVTQNARVEVSGGGGGSVSSQNVDFDTSFEGGARGGYWFNSIPWLGVGGSVSYFEPDAPLPGLTHSEHTNIAEVPITALLMLRGALLQSELFPFGQIQPYLNVGPGVFVTYLYGHDSDYSQSGADVGVDARAGAYVMVNPRIGVFGEYRFTHTDPDVSDDHYHDHSHGNGNVDVNTTLDTHHFLCGVSFRF